MDMILRSMLFVPANNWRMISRALREQEDAVILDLEDAVPPAEKETGRILGRDSLSIFKSKDIFTFVRINSLGTWYTAEDLKYIVRKDLDGVMLPKTESKEDIFQLETMLEAEEQANKLPSGSISIIPLLESPKGS